jgi:predicted permease
MPLAEQLWQDVRVALRTLAKEKTFTVLASVVLAIGICAVTTQFSMVHAFLFRGLPVDDPQQLVSVAVRDPAWPPADARPPARADYVDWNRQQTSFDGLATYYTNGSFIMVRGGSAERVDGGHVTENFFSLLRVAPTLGRDFTAADNRPEAERVTILSHAIWESDFGGDPNIVGRTFRLNGRITTVIGVMPPDFRFTRDRLWIPMFNEYPVGTRRGTGNAQVFGRLKPGRSPEQAAAEMTGIVQRIARDFPASNQKLTEVRVEPLLNKFVDRETRGLLFVMLAAVAGVLAIACVNVTNLQFARSIARRRDLAVRGALGASRGRLTLQIVTESLLLVAIGGAVGVLASFWTTALLQSLVRAAATSGVMQSPPWLTFEINRPVLEFTLTASTVSVLVAGLLPARSASRTNPIEALRDGARGYTGSAAARVMRSLVIGQIALTCALLVASLLLVRSIINRQNQSLGYDAGAIMTGRMNLETDFRREELRAFYPRLLSAFRATPGVTHVALTSRGSVAGAGFVEFELEGRPTAVGDEPRRARVDTVSDGYFATLGLRPLAGREFTPEDGGENRPLVVIINQPFATRHFPNTNPVGQRLRLGQQQKFFPATIIGVVPDTLMQGPVDSEGSDGAGLFVPLAANPPFYVSVVARGHLPPLQLFDPLRRSAAKLNPGLAIYSATTPEQSFERALLSSRIIAGMFSIFALVAVVLAALGLYGVVSLAVTQRVHEFGIRMALGAHGREIMRIVLRQGAMQLALGISVGITVSLALIRLGGSMFGGFLFQVSPHDPLVFGGVVLILGFATLIACVFPARFAAKVDPIIALRAELNPRS